MSNEEIGTEEQRMAGIKGGKVPAPFHIRSIQTWINRFPWDKIELPPDMVKPNIKINGKMDQATKNGLKVLKWLSKDIDSPILASAVNNIVKYNTSGDEDALATGASELFSAKLQVMSLLKDDKFEGSDAPLSYREKVNIIRNSGWPSYFPIMGRKNKGSLVSGGDRYGKLCGPWSDDKDWRACQTPKYNHFLMWGPDCPQCGMNGSDPRLLRLKSKYPEAFSYQKVKERLDNHWWHPVIPSPGFAPYIEPPPPGSPYYADPNYPKTNEEGVRFFDQEDENEYYRLRKLYDEFKAQEMKNTETVNYNAQFFKRHPYKKRPAPWKTPNKWSEKFYGRATNDHSH